MPELGIAGIATRVSAEIEADFLEDLVVERFGKVLIEQRLRDLADEIRVGGEEAIDIVGESAARMTREELGARWVARAGDVLLSSCIGGMRSGLPRRARKPLRARDNDFTRADR